MPVTNNNRRMIDRPVWEQCTSAPANSAAGAAMCDDNSRFFYIAFSVSSFWRHDTWTDTWQQLPNIPGGTLAAGSCLRYVAQMGSQSNGVVYGSVYALVASGSAVVFYRFDIGTATWSSALSTTNVPAAWGTDGRLLCPEPALNGYLGGYHSAVALNTITATSTAAAGATSIAVTALPLALPAAAVLNFGTAAAPVWAALTASAAAGATSITVAPLVAQVSSAVVAYWYADLFLFGNNAQVVYRYNFAANAWYTTSANAGNPALPATGTNIGAGCVACWLPGSGETNALDRLLLVCGGGSAVIREYSLSGNTVAAVTYYPAAETFTTGTASAIRTDASGRSAKLILQKDVTNRFYEFDRALARLNPRASLFQLPNSTALVGDRACVLKSPDGIEYLYFIPSTSAFLARVGLHF